MIVPNVFLQDLLDCLDGVASPAQEAAVARAGRVDARLQAQALEYGLQESLLEELFEPAPRLADAGELICLARAVPATKARRAIVGHSVATAGDVNGDGYSDIIVGAHGYDNLSYPDQGRVYVYLGAMKRTLCEEHKQSALLWCSRCGRLSTMTTAPGWLTTSPPPKCFGPPRRRR